ncbi:MAG: VWA-like domain-containing protein [Syntrophomonadaceae bacterium]|nr:VWA-like domain-containing protein [Syntrophomonadaceae bacterium]
MSHSTGSRGEERAGNDRSGHSFIKVLTWARTQLIISYPFFGMLALHLPLKIDPLTPTAHTDGRYIYLNPVWVEEVARREGREAIAGLVAHEVMHLALQHLWRRGTRMARLWNSACDFAVNSILAGAGLKLPAGALLNHNFNGLTAEEIYRLLSAAPFQPPPPQPWGEHRWEEAEQTQKEAAGLQREWEQRVARAAEAARQQGKLPGGLERLVKGLLYPQIDWRQALGVFLQPTRRDYSFIPPDRRFLSKEYQGLILPDFGQAGLEEVVIAIDTSGSVSEPELSAFLTESMSLLETFPELRGMLVTIDAAVTAWQGLASDEPAPALRLVGGGGTDFRPVFEEIEQRGVDPAAVVFLTDGAGTFPAAPPPYPVLWVIANNQQLDVPFGLKTDLKIK